MFGRKREERVHQESDQRKRQANKGGLSQFGLLDIGGNVDESDNDDDEELERELLALQSGSLPPRPQRKKPSKGDLDFAAIDKLLADKDDDCSDGDVDENDPELLAELEELTPDESITAQKGPSPQQVPDLTSLESNSRLVSSEISSDTSPNDCQALLFGRLDMYRSALTAAKSADDSVKARRLERGLKTLEGQLKLFNQGKQINPCDIPPPVSGAISAVKATFIPVEESPTMPPQPEITVQDVLPQPRRPAPLIPTMSAPPLPPKPKPKLSSTKTDDNDIFDEIYNDLDPLAVPDLLPPPLVPVRTNEVSSPMPSIQPRESAPRHELTTKDILTIRRDKYKRAALEANKNGDQGLALKHIKTSKQFDLVIGALESGQTVDLSNMPADPDGGPAVVIPGTNAYKSSSVPTVLGSDTSASDLGPDWVSTSGIDSETTSTSGSGTNPDVPMEMEEPLDPSVFNAPLAPTTVMEALQQRLQKYQKAAEDAKAEENSGKMRRMNRIVKQYEDAIKAHRAGKPVNYEELPSPPGFGPIPVGGQFPSSTAQQPVRAPVTPVPRMPLPVAITPEPPQKPVTPVSSKKPPVKTKSPQTVYEKQQAVLEERERLFKEAAVEAKQRGDITLAKEYLKLSKGFVPMIQATKCGLPVNMSTLPTPPQLIGSNKAGSSKKTSLLDSLTSGSEVIDEAFEWLPSTGDKFDLYQKLEADLNRQIEFCSVNSEHFKKMGEVFTAQKFLKLQMDLRSKLEMMETQYMANETLPSFYYEMRTFSIIQFNADLTDDTLEIEVVQGVNYVCSNPTEIDTFVRIEFPFPTDNPPKEKSHIVKNTNNPEYNFKAKFQINRKSRTFQRIIKTKTVKIEVWSKGGFLRSDQLVGTASLKISDVETKCNVHQLCDMILNRKLTGKIEVVIRVREPLVGKQIEQVKEKWLVIGEKIP